MKNVRSTVRRAVLALVVAGVTVACGPVAGSAGPPAVPSGLTSSSSAPVSSPPPTSAAPSPSAVVTPSPSPTATATSAPTPRATPKPADPKPAPAPSRTTAKPQAPVTKAPTEPPGGACEIVSNAGNCYNAGQFCRKADLGRSTHAANRRMIYCRMDGKQPRWQY
ncbi:hypothetical protein OG389_17190 [Streptomyces sp. NBC_00435]|uniref:hypothetical protein n=1 Tax=Streptomyces sp. NBC_00435 TaxID=2903649 RepID=UPI002E1CA9A3